MIELNGFRLSFSSPTFTAYLRDMPDNDELRPLKQRLGAAWFLYWDEGKVYGLPREAQTVPPFGEAVTVITGEHLRLLAARIADVLPHQFPQYETFRRRPFTFLSLKDELVEKVGAKIKAPSSLLTRFKIRPKFELDARLVESRDGDAFVGLFMQIQMRWEVLASLAELTQAGVSLGGLYVVRREPEPDQRRAVGRVDQVKGQMVWLSEAFDENQTSVPIDQVWLEGSKASFARCLKTILGPTYARFEEERRREEERFFAAPALEALLDKMSTFLHKKSPFLLAPDLECTVGERIAVANAPDYQSVVAAPPVEYCFDAARSKRWRHPWSGLERYGPFSRDTFPKKSPSILVLCPDTVQGKVENFVTNLRDGIVVPNGRSQYSASFGKTFGLVNPRFIVQRVPWLASGKTNAGAAYRRAAEEFLASNASPPDAAIVALLDEDADIPDAEKPYLQSKALLLMAGVPVQEVRLATITQTPYSLQFTLQNIAVALYAKMGGIPWTVDHDLTISDELIIGLGTVELSGSRVERRQRFVGVTTVFRGDGNYLLGNASRECSYDEYPVVLQEETTAVLRDIKARNGWQLGDTVRIVFHSFKPLRNVEIAEMVARCVREVGEDQNVEFAFLTISDDHPFDLLDRAQPGITGRDGSVKGAYVPERGTIVQLGRYTRLLATNGPSLLKRPDSPLPHPLLIRLHKESTYRDLTYLTEQVLRLTAMSWRSTLPASRPVSVYYSELIAGLLARLRSVRDWSPAMLRDR
ncbi:MAG: Piwi domain-containing protein, partial [Dehalococcoidales bacterium]|nr:Piwi domain-containing protein [Dehalococcoidales bacterium]